GRRDDEVSAAVLLRRGHGGAKAPPVLRRVQLGDSGRAVDRISRRADGKDGGDIPAHRETRDREEGTRMKKTAAAREQFALMLPGARYHHAGSGQVVEIAPRQSPIAGLEWIDGPETVYVLSVGQ